MEPGAWFSADYAMARRRFLDAAMAAGADVTSADAPVKGPAGDDLAVDEACLGSPVARRVLVVSSGLHGIEGFVGSALQLAWLETRGPRSLPADVRIVLVHGLNPFGFAWMRRWNEHNVDLNRNFLNDRSFLDSATFRECRRTYDRLQPFLNPATPPPRFEPYRLIAARWVLAVGRQRLQRTLPVGQYHEPRGLFYGGDAAEWTTALVRQRLATWVAGADRAVHLDVHSGLGRWAHCLLLSPEAPDSTRATWAAAALGPRVTTGDNRAYRAHGTMIEDLSARARPCDYHGFTMEFGTYSGVHVLGALRSENRAHHFAPAGTAVVARARRRLLEAFAPHSTSWRAAVVATGLSTFDRALAALDGDRARR